jgi:ABC-2 type transport system ATP-binding protein/lipopolysaccharide transport system ATP-binding protein
VVDEVLAVGDASFVPKCLDRIDDFRRRKKTILFVSHDLATVEKICDRVAWLAEGRGHVAFFDVGEPGHAVQPAAADDADDLSCHGSLPEAPRLEHTPPEISRALRGW